MKINFGRDYARVTILIDRAKGETTDRRNGYAIEGIDRGADESHEDFAARVAKRLVELQANPRAR